MDGLYIVGLSRPEIAIHKSIPGKHEARYVKRTQDYSMSFKLQIVQEIEEDNLVTESTRDLWHSK
jgi:hypothetical protein